MRQPSFTHLPEEPIVDAFAGSISTLQHLGSFFFASLASKSHSLQQNFDVTFTTYSIKSTLIQPFRALRGNRQHFASSPPDLDETR